MQARLSLVLAALAGLCLASCASVPRTGTGTSENLRIVLVDVEGGAAALFITPSGRSLLMDAGWPTGRGGARPAPDRPAPEPLDSAARIAAAARAAGIERIDYLVVTHYHLDHVGGVPDLLRAIPVGTVIDHGPNRETPPPGADPAALRSAAATLYAQYLESVAGHERRVMQAGDQLTVDGLQLVAVTSDGELVDALPGAAGAARAACEAATTKEAIGGEENPRSLGFLFEWGAARILALADTTWNLENALVCPRNRIGKIDLYIANHHGSELSNSPVFIDAIAPRVALVQNGPRKGGDAAVLDALRASPRLDSLWQLHGAERSPDRDEPAERIANLQGGVDGHSLHAEVTRSGAITVTNPRNGYSQIHPAGR